MNDRELLELAAKAEGHDVEFHESGLVFLGSRFDDLLWNPLHNDGDALRLAVNLDMLEPARRSYSIFQQYLVYEMMQGMRPSEATRRAIVRAAAEIGKAMP